ncbi:MAG: FHA domain-containing protein [Solirubrobacterales bacterium]|nr:FHA domain-containing protein [Solirubrobacterales bacterium]
MTRPVELKELLDAERTGRPFVVLRNGDGSQVLVSLDESRASLVIGRDPASDLCLDWDPLVSGLHARLECAKGKWLLHDDGLSRNGSFVNGERLHGQRLLREGDQLRFGTTHALFRDPVPRTASTVVADATVATLAISPAQKRVLVALCRPYKHRPPFARPATNQEIMDELFLSLDAVKSHLRALYEKCGLETVAQSEKRVRLVEHALDSGLVSEYEL